MQDETATVKQCLVNLAFTPPSRATTGVSQRGISTSPPSTVAEASHCDISSSPPSTVAEASHRDISTSRGDAGPRDASDFVETEEECEGKTQTTPQTYAEMTSSPSFDQAALRVQQRNGVDAATIAAACELLRSPHIAREPTTLVIEVQLYVVVASISC
jgi:hypothetical protein